MFIYSVTAQTSRCLANDNARMLKCKFVLYSPGQIRALTVTAWMVRATNYSKNREWYD